MVLQAFTRFWLHPLDPIKFFGTKIFFRPTDPQNCQKVTRNTEFFSRPNQASMPKPTGRICYLMPSEMVKKNLWLLHLLNEIQPWICFMQFLLFDDCDVYFRTPWINALCQLIILIWHWSIMSYYLIELVLSVNLGKSSDLGLKYNWEMVERSPNQWS